MKLPRVVFVISAALLLGLGWGALPGGCSKDRSSNPTPALPVCQVNPASLSFGLVYVGASKDLSFTIKNVGAGTLSGTVSSSASGDCGVYTVVTASGNYNLAAGDSIIIGVRFTPTAAQQFSCNIGTGTDRCSNMGCTGMGQLRPTGACCASSGVCSVTTQADCASPNSWQGAGTTCQPSNPCPQPAGACCTPAGICLVVTAAECASPSSWYGAGVTCSAGLCPKPQGACCKSDGTCSVKTQEECTQSGGSWMGAESTCSPIPCPTPTGACCAPSGACTVKIQDDCIGSNTWGGPATLCVPNNCPQPPGACCMPSGTCTSTVQATCAAPNVWLGANIACSPSNPCEQPRGACCRIDGTCAVIREADCATAGGAWQGDGVSCTVDRCPPPMGACCTVTAQCTLLQQADCTSGRTWQGAGTTCQPSNPCPPATGACCARDGSCILTAQAQCSGTSVWQGATTVCVPTNPCPQPSGACCAHDASCRLVPQAQCTSSESWLGGGTTCSPNICPRPTGACCNSATGACSLTTQTLCVSPSNWLGMDTTCQPTNPCPQPQGACCAVDGSCTVATQVQCASPNVWQGATTVCAPTNPCPQPQGACCAADGSCTVATQALCVSPGVWQGSTTACAPNPCPQPQGACCVPDGSCTAAVTQAQCVAPNVWQGSATVCSPNPCPGCSMLPSNISFGSLPLGAIKDTTFVISNLGIPTLNGTVGTTCSHLTVIAGGSFSIDAGDTKSVTVRFSPTTAGLHSCTVDAGLVACGTVICTGTGIQPPTGMLYVSGDTLRMGQAGITDAPPYDVKVGSFYIDKYEITTSQYKAFIDAGGYADSVLWNPVGWQWLKAEAALGDTIRAPEGWKAPLGDGSYLHNNPDLYPTFPVQGISWWEADAYARYKGKRLPTEAEWELAAKSGCKRWGDLQSCDGSDRPDFPWGSGISGTRANYSASGDPYEGTLGGTTPVGYFDGRAGTTDSPSLTGIYDLAGNVVEWCSSAHDPYPYNAADGREAPPLTVSDSRVLRGGSYKNTATSDLRCAVRFSATADDRGTGVVTRGFRCAKNP